MNSTTEVKKVFVAATGQDEVLAADQFADCGGAKLST